MKSNLSNFKSFTIFATLLYIENYTEDWVPNKDQNKKMMYKIDSDQNKKLCTNFYVKSLNYYALNYQQEVKMDCFHLVFNTSLSFFQLYN